ncbi:MAG: ankyrin repeat domain-containing protein [Puniceicoccales bacterium]|nr:ankyrin repeat domain-containing protein [Puniceicoccales bacterium]
MSSCLLSISHLEGAAERQYLAAASNDDLPGVLAAIAQGVNVNVTGRIGRTALIEAAASDRPAVVGVLVNTPGILVNAQDNGGRTALHWAAANECPEVARVLVNAPGILVNARDGKGLTALHLAAASGHPKVVSVLVNAPGILVNAQDGEGRTALHWATEWLSGYDNSCNRLINSQKTAEVLVNAPGINVNALDNTGMTAFHLAAAKQNVPVFILLKGVANNNIRDPQGNTAEELMRKTYNPELSLGSRALSVATSSQNLNMSTPADGVDSH